MRTRPDLLRIRGLGAATADQRGAALAAFSAPRLQELLVQLWLRRGAPAARGELAYRLWPDSTDGQARTNLRHLLHDLRVGVPDADRHLDVTAQTLQWRLDAPAWVDLIAVEEAWARAAVATEEATERAALADAAAAYGGDLLPGSYVDWVLGERDRLRQRAVESLYRLSELHERAGDRAAAVGAVEALLRHDPLHELAYQRLMRLHAASGDRARALRAFHACATRLEEELGVPPGDATRAVYESVIEGRVGGGPRPPGRYTARSLVGRGPEWERMLSGWRQACDRGPRMLLVTGEPGIGKSRLADELARTAGHEGAAVARSRCYEVEGRLAFAPVCDWLQAQPVRGLIERLDGPTRAELARVVPDLVAAAPPAGDTSDPSTRQRLFRALAAALHAVDRPLLLVLDDIQWCDPDTVGFIRYLLRSDPDFPLLVAAAARTPEGDAHRELTALAHDLGREDLLDVVALAPLSPEEAVELAERLAGHRLETGVAARLAADTDGNPLFVVEAVRAGLPVDGDDAIRLTSTVQSLIRSRLGRLSRPARELLELAATLGRDVTVELLGAAAGGEESVIEPLDELWQLRVLRERDASAYDFVHDRVREVAYDAISPARRRHLHRVCAEALAAVAPDPDAVAGRLAAHYEQAGMFAPAIEAGRRAAAHAQRLLAFDDAIATLERCLALLDRLAGRERGLTELAVTGDLGVALVAKLGYAAAPVVEAFTRAEALATRLGEGVGPQALRGLALASIVTRRFDRSRSYGTRLLELGAEGQHLALVEGHYVLGVTSFWEGRLAEAQRELETAIALYEPADHAAHLALFAQDPHVVCLVRLGWCRWYLGDGDGALAAVSDARERAEWLGHPSSLAYVMCYEAMLACDMGREDDAARVAAEAGALWSGRVVWFSPMVSVIPGWIAVRRGEANGRAVLAAGVADCLGPGLELHWSWGAALLVRAHLEAGDLSAARALLDEAIAATDRTGQHYLTPELIRLDGGLRAAAGESGAADRLAAAIEIADAQGNRFLAARAAASLADIGPDRQASPV